MTPGVVVVAALALVAAFGAFTGSLVWVTGGLTLGKAYCGLRVRRRSTTAIKQEVGDLARLVGRQSWGYAVIDVFGAGCLLGLRSPRRRFLHDLVFDTEVVAAPAGLTRVERIEAMERARREGLEQVKDRWLWFYPFVKWTSWLPVKAAAAVVLAAEALKLVSPVAQPASTASTSGLPTGSGLGPGWTAGVTAGTTAATTAIAVGVLAGSGSGATGVTVQHAGFAHTITEATVRAHPPGEADAEEDPDPEVDHYMLRTSLSNVGVPTDAARFIGVEVNDLWSLVLRDGTILGAESIEVLDADRLGWVDETIRLGEDDREFFISFRVDPRQRLDDAQLRIQLFDYEPTVVALAGGRVEPVREEAAVIDASYEGPLGFEDTVFRIDVSRARRAANR